MLVGMGAPYRAKHRPGVQEMGIWRRHLAEIATQARAAASENRATLLGTAVKA